MKYNAEYFGRAEKVIFDVIEAYKPELMANYGKVKAELKSDDTVVTELDKNLETKLRAALKQFDPEVGFLGEEFGQEGNEETYWLIDPIDGTESYIRGLSACRSVITFVDKDQVQYAYAYRFITNDIYSAIKGHGVKKNGQPTRVNQQPIERAWLEFSVNMMHPEGYEMYKKIKAKVASVTVHQDFLRVIDGGLEGLIVYKSGGKLWDYAPRAFFISEAGGKVMNIGKDTYDIHNFDLIATNPVIFDEIRSLLTF